MMNIDQIKETIPYDDPFLWVKEVESISDDSIVANIFISKDQDFFKGHFVDYPIMPGVIIVEGIAQTATILLRQKIKDHKDKHLLAYQVRYAAFVSPVLPDSKLVYKVRLVGFYEDKFANFVGEAYVENEKKCEVRFSIVVMDKKVMKEKFNGNK